MFSFSTLAPPLLAEFKLDFDAIIPSLPFILGGFGVTLQFTLISLFFGFIWGTILALFKISSIKPLYWFGRYYTSIFRGVPLLVSLSVIYFATPQITGFNIQPLQAGILTFSLNAGAYISEVIRAGVLAVDRGQTEAAMSLGVTYQPMMMDIILPQAIKNILPALVNETIALFKDSSLVATIGAQDLLRRAQIVGAEKYLYFEPLVVVSIIYYGTVIILTIAANVLERRLHRSS